MRVRWISARSGHADDADFACAKRIACTCSRAVRPAPGTILVKRRSHSCRSLDKRRNRLLSLARNGRVSHAHDCFADEIAIDFPSVDPFVERVRDAFLGERAEDDTVTAEVSVSPREASRDRRAARSAAARHLPLTAAAAAKPGPNRAWPAAAPATRSFRHPVRVSVPAARGRRRALPFPRQLAARRAGARRSAGGHQAELQNLK